MNILIKLPIWIPKIVSAIRGTLGVYDAVSTFYNENIVKWQLLKILGMAVDYSQLHGSSIVTVSYTHLDVYKRQLCDHNTFSVGKQRFIVITGNTIPHHGQMFGTNNDN